VPNTAPSKYDAPGRIHVVRTAIAALLVVVGIAWVVVYDWKAFDDPKKISWMYDLGNWNWLIGFGMFMLGLIIAAHKGTPLGRGRGVVVGMLGCFLLGLIWIVTYYFVGQDDSVHIPVMDQLNQANLLVGVGFMAVGFTYATKWE
jgi:hypothetical protein